MASIRARLDEIKEDPSVLIDPEIVERACGEVGHRWRERTLDPVTTLRAFAVQVAHGNTAISHTIRLIGAQFSESAYCQARARLPPAVVGAVLEAVAARIRGQRADDAGLWCGRRATLIDGSGVSVPDTPELREAFGTAGSCAPGCGLPQAHTLWVFDADTGQVLGAHAAPATTGDPRYAQELHPALRPGDVLVGDRGLCSYTHLAMLREIGCHGVFRLSARRAMPFPAKSGERTRHDYNRHRRHEPILVELIGDDDQIVEIVKPSNRPDHLTPEQFAKIPAKMLVRAVRYIAKGKGLRTRTITLLTDLTDAKRYPARALADLYLMRWRVETNLRHLKRTMGMDRLKCRSIDGVARELMMFALIYNAVCQVRARAARAGGVPPTRVSFVDTLRAMLVAGRAGPVPRARPPDLKVWPSRPSRAQPRRLKRDHSHFPVMIWPRRRYIEWIDARQRTAN